jgi:hypothetical protein
MPGPNYTIKLPFGSSPPVLTTSGPTFLEILSVFHLLLLIIPALCPPHFLLVSSIGCSQRDFSFALSLQRSFLVSSASIQIGKWNLFFYSRPCLTILCMSLLRVIPLLLQSLILFLLSIRLLPLLEETPLPSLKVDLSTI